MNNLFGYIKRCISSYNSRFFDTVMSYRSMVTFLVAMLLAFSTIIEAQPIPPHRKHYCGAALANILSVACRGNYNQMYDGIIKKRSLNRHLEASRDSGGIVEECCTNQCSMQTIKQYCAAEIDDDTYGFSSDQSDTSRMSPDTIKSRENTKREKEPGGRHTVMKDLVRDKAGRKRAGNSNEKVRPKKKGHNKKKCGSDGCKKERRRCRCPNRHRKRKRRGKIENDSISTGFETVPGFEIGTVSPSYFNRPVFIPENHKHPVWNDAPYS